LVVVKDTILIIGAASIGDTVVAVPCFSAIANKYRDSRRILLTRTPENAKFSPSISVLGEGTGFVDGVLEFEFGSWNAREIIWLARQIRTLKPKLAIFLRAGHGSVGYIWRQMAFLRVCGIKEFVGIPAAPSLFQNQLDPITGLFEHEAVFLARRLSEIGPVPLDTDAAWDLRLTPHEHEAAMRLLSPLAQRPFIVFHMGTKEEQAKDWGEQNWTSLCKRMATRYPEMGLVVVGTKSDSDRAARVQSHWKGMTLDACGKVAVRETAALISRARLFVGHDSGPGHLAATARVPIVSIHSNLASPGIWYPFGSTSKVLRARGPIETISVDAVFEAVIEQLDSSHTMASFRRDAAGAEDRRTDTLRDRA
jgi:heptosyltransferase-3